MALTREELELTILTEISQTLGSTLNLEEVFQAIMGTLAHHLNMKRGTLVLLDEASGKLKIRAAHGLTQEEISRGTYARGEGVTGRVVETGRPMVVDDVRKHPMFLDRTGARKKDEEAIISFVCTPIKVENRVVGAISADRAFLVDCARRQDLVGRLVMLQSNAQLGEVVQAGDPPGGVEPTNCCDGEFRNDCSARSWDLFRRFPESV